MLNVASTESFDVVREQFFRSYLENAIAQGPSTPYPPKSSGHIPVTFESPSTAWSLAAKKFSGTLAGISKHYAGSGLAEQNARAEQIEAALKKPGTPYEKVGHVLAWFKEWRKEQRKIQGSHPNNAYDTRHHKLQEAMTELLLEVSYAMIADDRHAPVQALHVLRNQPKNSVCDDPTPALSKPEGFFNYTSYNGRGHAQRLEGRQEWVAKSEKYREQLEHASPWTIAMDWAWKNSLCFKEGSTVKTKIVPPIYTLGKYLLVVDESTWDRQRVCDALVLEKTFSPAGQAAQSGLEIGLAARPNMDVAAYEAWWKEQERSSAKDWRYIRRSSVLLTRKSTLENITVGDAVARIKKFGPAEVVNGAFVYEESDIKALLLERIQPELGRQYETLKQVEDAMGPMPDVIIESLNAQLKKNRKTHAEPELDMGNLFG